MCLHILTHTRISVTLALTLACSLACLLLFSHAPSHACPRPLMLSRMFPLALACSLACLLSCSHALSHVCSRVRMLSRMFALVLMQTGKNTTCQSLIAQIHLHVGMMASTHNRQIPHQTYPFGGLNTAVASPYIGDGHSSHEEMKQEKG